MEFLLWSLSNDPRYTCGSFLQNPYLLWMASLMIDIPLIVNNVLLLDEAGKSLVYLEWAQNRIWLLGF